MYRTNLNDEEFVRAWQSAKSVSDVAKKFKISRTSASCRAFRLRKAGVRIKKLPRGPKRFDVSKLNRIARKAT